MKILVTGAVGFIGSHLCQRLLSLGHELVGVDNFDPYYDPTVKAQNAGLLRDHSGFILHRVDIRDDFEMEKIFHDHRFELVIHLAAKAGVRPSILHAPEYMSVNIDGLTRLLERSRSNGVRRFLFASSSSVYGNQHKIPFSESDPVDFPISPYAASKRSGELLCHVYHHLYHMEVACLRLFTVYGPRQRPDLAIHKFIGLALQNTPIDLYGDGSSRRDYTYVSDIVNGFERLAFHPQLGFEIFNIGNGQPVKLLDLVQALERVLNRNIALRFIDKQAGDVDQTFADISKARQYLGYQPMVGLDEGVKSFVDWYMDSDQKS
ncbi:MAG TPA: NAD-dependent epimerase/dehydratase family protein [Saprospiraceae bacterium]|nr:NAD-dependent epimerase/dehydratase family protein [Saprospiraceae bacterium]